MMTFEILLFGLVCLPAVAALIYVLTRGAGRKRDGRRPKGRTRRLPVSDKG